jgi:hypothetical protein
MNHLKNIFIVVLILLTASYGCKKEVDNKKYVDNVTAPANLKTNFDISQDNTGDVTIVPTADGATMFLVKFGDVEDETATEFGVSERIVHTYPEGVFTVEVTAVGLTGLSTKTESEINVTFRAPENLVLTVTQDEQNPRLVTVSAVADYATIMDFYFGDVPDEEPVNALPGEEVQHTYEDPGDYVITVIAKSGGEATTEAKETVNVPSASDPVTLPVDFESFSVNYAFENFGNATSTVIDNPDASGINTSGRVAEFVKADGAENWAGSLLTLDKPIDFSVDKLFKMKVWSPKTGAVVKLKVENMDNGDIAYEVDAATTVSNQWEELTYDFSAIDLANDYQKIVFFFDFENPGDGATYYYDDVEQASVPSGGAIVGTWKVAPEAGSLGVGPAQGDISWWSIDDAGVTERACFYDDTYVFGNDGSFMNVLGAETWVEGWQGGEDACGAPVAPHDGSNPATYIYDAGSGNVTINGKGSYLGIPKPYNGGELTSPDEAPESITYIVVLSEGNTRMTVDIEINDGGWWRYIMVKEGGSAAPPIVGSWSVKPEAGSLGVGPGQGDITWWSIDDAGVTERACFYDDTYVFGEDGSFMNVLGADTWVEDWQGGTNACGAPVAPHDGSNPATYTYDEGSGTVTVNGTGAFLGIPKAYNGGELTDPANAPESITYLVTLSEDQMEITVDIEINDGGWWRFILVKN